MPIGAGRIIDLSDRAARLSTQNSLLVLRFPAPALTAREAGYRCERLSNPDEITVPFGEIAVVIASHPQVSLTHKVLSEMGAAGAIFIACDERHMPVSMLLPLSSHSIQTERFAAQAAASAPLKKQAWKQIVRAKIQAQARLLEVRTGNDRGLSALASAVRSGDPANLEAQAARIYWREVFGTCEFRRDSDREGLNACLNYGYAVLRAIVARALCGAGLHPSLGVHHHNRYDTFCLADDLMEPFRPLVDTEVAKLMDARGPDVPLDREAKQGLLAPLMGRFTAEGESRTLFDWANRVASSLVSVIEGSGERLEIPALEASPPEAE